ncbi:flagellar hook-length control protein FliK [Heyndrickxia sp. MSNUG]|uniref:flagellar hook-length control protein FliK n=1 Tax=Heyndrickxia sp. MSNUG TaxID=3136677 RepID=UPI003C2CC886
MEVGAIAVKQNSPVRSLESTSVKGKFSEALSDVQTRDPHSDNVTKESAKTDEKSEMSNGTKETSILLQKENITELEAGMDIPEGMDTADVEALLEKILEQLGISSSQLDVFIQKWTSHSDEEAPFQEDVVQQIAKLLSEIADLPQKELANKLDKNDLQILKSLKFHALFVKNAPSPGEKVTIDLDELLQGIGEKLGSLTEPIKVKTDIIQMRFTRLAAELNMEEPKKVNLEVNFEAESPAVQKTESASNQLGFLPQIGRLEQLSIMRKGPEKMVSGEALMKQFESILSKSQFLNSGGTQKLFIKLFPEHLGSVRVELFQKDQTMIARIITTTGTAKDALESHVNGLKQAFAAQNITVERIEISQQSSQQERFLNRDPHQQHRQPDRQEQDSKEDQGDFNLSFEEALLNTEA